MKNLNTAPHQKHPFSGAGFLAIQQEWAQMDSAALWAEAKTFTTILSPGCTSTFALAPNNGAA